MRRLFEIIPGAAAWLTLLALLVFSARLPAVVVVFIVLYDLFWFLKVTYLFFHLQLSFREFRQRLHDGLQRLPGIGPAVPGRVLRRHQELGRAQGAGQRGRRPAARAGGSLAQRPEEFGNLPVRNRDVGHQRRSNSISAADVAPGVSGGLNLVTRTVTARMP
ncbi:MAG: hypothetical protein AAB601_02215, partial [Patescibacteria group bacterium]